MHRPIASRRAAQSGDDPRALPADAARDRRRAHSTIVFPLPINLITPLLNVRGKQAAEPISWPTRATSSTGGVLLREGHNQVATDGAA
jgi:hypothetical protein